MKKLIITIIILGIVVICFAQKGKSNLQMLKFAKEFVIVKGTDSNSSFSISSKPITNREYIIYLLWLQEVYADYPIVVNNAIPRQNDIVWYDTYYDADNSHLNNLLKGMTQKDKEYVFNSIYLDYPVVGLSWQQAMDFSKWLSDRYNEFALIREKFYQLDLYQRNENCFITESYLSGQFMGLISNPSKEIKWNDNLLIPAFRLPTKAELTNANNKISYEMKAYSAFSFLKPWYFETKVNDTVILSFGKIEERNFIKLFPTKIDAAKPAEELTLDTYLLEKSNNNYDVFESIGLTKLNYCNEQQTQKDSLGRMPYCIIGENLNNEIVAVKNFSTLKNQQYSISENKIFRVVSNSKSNNKN